MRHADPTKITLSIYEYLDFRKYLRDLIAELKSKRGFRLKDFAAKAKIKSQGLLGMVIDGKRRLTGDMRDAFCHALDITGDERAYFKTLVDYAQTHDPDAKQTLFVTLNKLRPRSHQFSLEKKHHRYLTHDYYVTIREMVNLNDFREDYEWMAARCAPAITSGEAKEAVETLIDLGMLKRDADGRLTQAQTVVRTADVHTQAVEAYHFHDAVLSKARTALGYWDQENRNYQSITLTMPKNMTDEVIAKYNEFRDWILQRANATPVCDEVYQINFQLFPATAQRPESPAPQKPKSARGES